MLSRPYKLTKHNIFSLQTLNTDQETFATAAEKLALTTILAAMYGFGKPLQLEEIRRRAMRYNVKVSNLD